MDVPIEKQMPCGDNIHFTVKCSDDTANFIHYPGQYAWRFMQRLVDSGGEEVQQKYIDLSEYISTKGLFFLQSIFDETRLCIESIRAHYSKRTHQVWPGNGMPSHEVEFQEAGFIECLPWTILLDIRYCDTEHYFHMTQDEYINTISKFDGTHSYLSPSAAKYFEPRHVTMAPPTATASLTEDDFGVAPFSFRIRRSDYIPVALLQCICDALESRHNQQNYMLKKSWFAVACADTMHMLMPFMYKNFSLLVAGCVADHLLANPCEMSPSNIERLHDSIISHIRFFGRFKKDLSHLRHHPFYATVDLFDKYIYQEVQLTEAEVKAIVCDRTHHKKMACPKGICCAYSSPEKLVQDIGMMQN